MDIRQLRGFWPAFLILAVASVISIVFVVQIQATSDATQNIYKPTIRVWVHGDSIRPSIIHTRPGVVVLRAENETRSELSLVVEKVLPGGNIPVARIATADGGKRVRRELIVEPGEYVFYDAARPRIKGTLIVELPDR